MRNNTIFFHQYVSKEERPNLEPFLYRLLKPFEKHRHDAVMELMNSQAKEQILDIGCGSGNFLLQNQHNWVHATGIDVVPELIQQAKEKSDPKLFTFLTHESSNKSLPFKNESFTIVTCIATLQYIEDLDLLFSEVARVLKKNGIFIFEVPNFLVFWRRIQLLFGIFPHTSSFHSGWNGGVIHYFTYSKVKKFAEQKNYKIKKMESSGIFCKIRNFIPSLLGANCITVCQKK